VRYSRKTIQSSLPNFAVRLEIAQLGQYHPQMIKETVIAMRWCMHVALSYPNYMYYSMQANPDILNQRI
jgi:hypothetical protein